jgi:predicted nucleic acid-binding protein
MPANNVVVDSSFLVALYDRDSVRHREVAESADAYRGYLIIPQVTLTEAAYLFKRRMGQQGAITFLSEFARSQPALQHITVNDRRRVTEIMQQYASANFDFVDCCITALCERLDITRVGTLDQRDFSIFRPRHCEFLRIIP